MFMIFLAITLQRQKYSFEGHVQVDNYLFILLILILPEKSKCLLGKSFLVINYSRNELPQFCG